MIKNMSKFVLQVVSMVFVLCLLTPVLGSPAHMVTEQEPVTKNGAYFADVVEFHNNGRAAAITANKITANGAKCGILYYGAVVGNFVFNKHNNYIEIEITEHVAVDVMWHCSAEEARCTLKGEGVYRLPQLLQDCGKTVSFDAIWIQSVDVHDPTDLPDFIEGSIAAMVARFPDVTDSQIDALRAQWAEQIALKMKRIKETNGAVLNPDQTRTMTATLNVYKWEENYGGGSVESPYNVLQYPDNKFARFYTPSANQCATVVASMTALVTGDVYVRGYRSSVTTGQYAIVYGSTTGAKDNFAAWPPIGYTKISTTSSSDHFIGYAGTAYFFMAVGCNTYMGDPSTYNDFYLDGVLIPC